MEIYTSYYKKLEKFGSEYTCVQVSNTKPGWFPWTTFELKEIYPKWELVNGLKQGFLTREEYTEKYQEQLARVSRERIIDILEDLSNMYDDKPLVLLCYENKSGFCHRHILAAWLGLGITELEV